MSNVSPNDVKRNCRHEPAAKLNTDLDVENWLQEVADQLVARAEGKRKNVKTSSKGKHGDDLTEAKERSVALSTTADVKGVSFKGRAMQKLYFETKFVRRGRLIYDICKEFFAEKVKLPQQKKLVVSCLGGGPGNDAAGVVAANCRFLGYLPTPATASPSDTKSDTSKISLKQAHANVREARVQCEEIRLRKEACERRFRKATDAADDARKCDCKVALDKNIAALQVADRYLVDATARLASLQEMRQKQQVESTATPLSQRSGGETENSRSQTLHVNLFDFEAQWRSYESTLSSHFAPYHAGVTFNTCDVTQSILDKSNSVVESCLASTDLYIFCYVCNETSAAAASNGYKFYVDLARGAKMGAVFLFCDVQGYSQDALENIFDVMNGNVNEDRTVVREFVTGEFQKRVRSQIMLLYVMQKSK